MALRTVYARLRALWHRTRKEAELDDEIRFHLTEEADKRIAAERSAEQARREARKDFGNIIRIREATRDVWGLRHVDELIGDLRIGARGLAKRPGFTATAVLTLLIGIGANTAMFSIVNEVLLRPLPYPDAERIVHVGAQFPPGLGFRDGSIPFPALRREADAFEEIVPRRTQGVLFSWGGIDGPQTGRGLAVSPSLFRVLRAAPLLGRLFTDADAQPGTARVVLLSFETWSNRFAADPDIVGAPIDLFDGGPHSVVGVMPDGFYYASRETEVWTPLAPDARNFFGGLARLRDGVSPEQAVAEVRTIVNRGRSTPVGPSPDGAPETEFVVTSLDPPGASSRPPLVALMAATGLVLLIACANIAALLLSRGLGRQREIALRAALGAGRARLVRQLLTESVLLSVGGGALGLFAATWIVRAVPTLVPFDVPGLSDVSVDSAALAFSVALSVVVGLTVGALPALQWSRPDLVRTLTGSAQSTADFRLRRANWSRAALVSAQVALACVILVGATLLVRSFTGWLQVDPGYDPANLLTAKISNPSLQQWEDPTERRRAMRQFGEALLERLELVPGVEAVGMSNALPLTPALNMMPVMAMGRPPPGDTDMYVGTDGFEFTNDVAIIQNVSAGYFDALGMRLLSGRGFTDRETRDSSPVTVVNETLERELFGGESAVGHRLRRGGPVPAEKEIIGVVSDVKYHAKRPWDIGLDPTAVLPEFYLPYLGVAFSPWLSIRATGDPLALVPFLRATVAEVDPWFVVDDVMTMEARLSASIAQPRFFAVFVGGFAAIALFLATFGIYGVLAHTVAQRRREIGVRMALGAQRADVVGLVVRQGAMMVAAGAVVGLAAAAASTRVLASLLFGVTATDLPTFTASAILLLVVGLVACYLPARRATRIDPMVALRHE